MTLFFTYCYILRCFIEVKVGYRQYFFATGNVGNCQELSGNVGKCREMSGNVGKCRGMSGNVGSPCGGDL